MTPKDAVRRHLLAKLRHYDSEAAEHLSGGLDAAYLKDRLRATARWTTGWRKWIWIVAFAVGMFLMAASVASEDVEASAALGVMIYFMGIMEMANRWRRKRALYETLTILADPTYEPGPPFG